MGIQATQGTQAMQATRVRRARLVHLVHLVHLVLMGHKEAWQDHLAHGVPLGYKEKMDQRGNKDLMDSKVMLVHRVREERKVTQEREASRVIWDLQDLKEIVEPLAKKVKQVTKA